MRTKKKNSRPTSQYAALINHDTLVQTRMVIVIGLALFASFAVLDRLTYPDLARQFWKIRLLVCLAFLVAFFLTFVPMLAKRVVWICDALMIASSAGLCRMIYLSDGVHSHYAQGLSQVLLGGFLANSLYARHHVVSGLLVVGLYNLAIYLHDPGLSLSRIISANFFIVTTVFFVALMTVFFKHQHHQRFVDRERLRESTRRLSEVRNKLKDMYAVASEQARRDPMTSMFNRRYFEKILNRRLSVIRGTNGAVFVIILDIDKFKAINDGCGHGEGDNAIRAIADCIQKCLGEIGVACRYGGDEFLLMLEVREIVECEIWLRELMSRVSQVRIGGSSLRVSIGAVRVGGSQVPTASEVIRRADEALLNVKQQGGDAFRVIAAGA